MANKTKHKRSNNQSQKEKEKEEAFARSLDCFLNQPNINMIIPWVYEIYRSVRQGGGGGEDEPSDKGLTWDED